MIGRETTMGTTSNNDGGGGWRGVLFGKSPRSNERGRGAMGAPPRDGGVRELTEMIEVALIPAHSNRSFVSPGGSASGDGAAARDEPSERELVKEGGEVDQRAAAAVEGNPNKADDHGMVFGSIEEMDDVGLGDEMINTVSERR